MVPRCNDVGAWHVHGCRVWVRIAYLATAGTIQISVANPNSRATSPTPGSAGFEHGDIRIGLEIVHPDCFPGPVARRDVLRPVLAAVSRLQGTQSVVRSFESVCE
jgi:hypothetical protein